MPRDLLSEPPNKQGRDLFEQGTGYQPSMVPWLDPINSFANSFVEGIPVIGPTLSEWGSNVDAAFASLVEGQPVTPEERAAINQAEQEQFPEAALAGGVTGAIAPMIPLGMTQVGAKALGMTGPMAQRMAFGAGSGFGLGAADTAARGGDLNDTLTWGGIGAALGGGLPVAERVVSPVARALFGLPNPSPGVRNVAANLERDGISPSSVSDLLREFGPDAVLADLGPNLQRTAGAVASLPGEGQTVLREAMGARQAGRNARIQGDVNAALGPAPLPSAVQGEIRASQQALSPLYERALEGARAVDTSDLALTLDSMAVNLRGDAQKAAQRVRDMLDVAGVPGTLDPNPATLLATRQAIDGMMDGVTDNNVRRVLTMARQSVDDTLARAVPGIKDVDAQFAELARQGDAFQTGVQALDSGRTAVRPAELAEQFAQGSEGVQLRMSQGARTEIDRLIGTTANNVNALKSALKGDGSWNRDRLVTLFGRDKADQLLDVLEREVTFDRTFNTIMSNSETAARQAAQKEVAPRQWGGGTVSIPDLLLKPLQWTANAAARGRGEAVNAQIAELLMSQPRPETVDQMIAALIMGRGRIGSAPVPALTGPQE